MTRPADRYEQWFADPDAFPGFAGLPAADRAFIGDRVRACGFTFQQTRQIAEIAVDLRMWDEGSVADRWPVSPPGAGADKQTRAAILRSLAAARDRLRESPGDYGTFTPPPAGAGEAAVVVDRDKDPGFGRCPVASAKTRCCNLMTLDAVESCGYDCSYCTIQSFYHGGRVSIVGGLAGKLDGLRLDPDAVYHVGTGQSSDSLMWGNRAGILDALAAFARKNPNVILELKTKSARVDYFMARDAPPNVICTWSLNTDTIVENEERLTAAAGDRIAAARRVADRGVLVGFHFHPIARYRGWRGEYERLYRQVTDTFDPAEVAMVSFGTLTYIKPVIRQIRRRGLRTRALRMPLVEAAGKLSCPAAVKEELFGHAHQCFAGWHGKVFFYLCMEPPALWEPVFGFDYASNDAFEAAMKAAYMKKIDRARG